MKTKLLVTALVASGALALQGCNAVECADGTIEQDGTCVPASDDPSAANCGEGTVLGDSGQCEPAMPPTVCGMNTLEDTESIPGVITCVGTGGAGSCADPLPCPGAAANKVTVCGRLFDIETDAQITDDVTTNCDLENPAASGPCELQIKFYDALDFAGNPTGATALVPQNMRMDQCGRYVAENIPRPSLGFLGIGVADHEDIPMGDRTHRLTGVAFPVTSGQVRNGQATYVIRESTNMAWSTDPDVTAAPGGVSGSSTFVTKGVFMSIFKHGNTPVAGVTVTSNGSARAADDFYFSDTSPTTRLDVLPGGPTQVNGAALLLNSSLVEHSGTGGEPGTCVWPSDLAASIPGVLFFNPRIAEMTNGDACP